MDPTLLRKISDVLDVVNEIRRLNNPNQQLLKELEVVERRQERERDALLSLVRELEATLTLADSRGVSQRPHLSQKERLPSLTI